MKYFRETGPLLCFDFRPSFPQDSRMFAPLTTLKPPFAISSRKAISYPFRWFLQVALFPVLLLSVSPVRADSWPHILEQALARYGEEGRAAADFLAANRPGRDDDLDPDIALEAIAVSLQARERFPWAREVGNLPSGILGRRGRCLSARPADGGPLRRGLHDGRASQRLHPRGTAQSSLRFVHGRG